MDKDDSSYSIVSIISSCVCIKHIFKEKNLPLEHFDQEDLLLEGEYNIVDKPPSKKPKLP
jgi:hypothetical protein